MAYIIGHKKRVGGGLKSGLYTGFFCLECREKSGTVQSDFVDMRVCKHCAGHEVSFLMFPLVNLKRRNGK